jgi:hypothetical protein
MKIPLAAKVLTHGFGSMLDYDSWVLTYCKFKEGSEFEFCHVHPWASINFTIIQYLQIHNCTFHESTALFSRSAIKSSTGMFSLDVSHGDKAKVK